MSDALYALYYEWECNKEKHGKSYRHSLEFKQRICGLKGGDAKPDDPKVMEWMNRKKAKFGCHLQTASTSSGAAFSYLEKSGKPLLSNGMLRPMLEACHQATGCRAAKYLRAEFLSKFCVGKWSTKLVREAAINLKCGICDGSRPLPKKQHVESIFTYGIESNADGCHPNSVREIEAISWIAWISLPTYFGGLFHKVCVGLTT